MWLQMMATLLETREAKNERKRLSNENVISNKTILEDWK